MKKIINISIAVVTLCALYFVLPRFVWIKHGYIGFAELQKQYGEKIEKPVFSVILPTYNRAAYLPRAITSVQGQTFTNFELIVIDDGSTDNTKEVVESFQKNDPRIIYIDSDKNYGVSHARNLGLKAARGKYVTILDSDDMFFPALLATEYRYFKEHDDIDVLAVKPYRLYDDGSIGGKDYYMMNSVFFLFENYMVNIGTSIRQSFLQKSGVLFDEEWHTTEDYKFYADLLIKGAKFHMLDQYLVGIRYHSSHAKRYYTEMKTHADDVVDLMKKHFSPQTNNVCSYIKEIDGKFDQFSKTDIARAKFFFCSGDYSKNDYYILNDGGEIGFDKILIRDNDDRYCDVSNNECCKVQENLNEETNQKCILVTWEQSQEIEQFCTVGTNDYWKE